MDNGIRQASGDVLGKIVVWFDAENVQSDVRHNAFQPKITFPEPERFAA